MSERTHPGPSRLLTLSCQDQVGIVAAVSGHLASVGCFILDSQQYADLTTARFFMRVEFVGGTENVFRLRSDFEPIAQQFHMNWDLVSSGERSKLIIAVSKASHCLNDLLHRWHAGSLSVDVVGVVSNHPDLRSFTEWYGVPYHYLPVSEGSRKEQEAKLLSLFDQAGADYLILARYMQVLSPELAARLKGRCINIHHSFLPSFKGARPYRRAHEHGVRAVSGRRESKGDSHGRADLIQDAGWMEAGMDGQAVVDGPAVASAGRG